MAGVTTMGGTRAGARGPEVAGGFPDYRGRRGRVWAFGCALAPVLTGSCPLFVSPFSCLDAPTAAPRPAPHAEFRGQSRRRRAVAVAAALEGGPWAGGEEYSALNFRRWGARSRREAVH